jgi:hypothetical protein
MPVTALRALCSNKESGGDQEFPRCLITNDRMSCGSRFPPKRKALFPILAARPTLKLAAALVRQAAIPSQGIGALSRRRSLAGRAGAHPCSTPYSVEQADPDPRPWRDVGIARSFARVGDSRGAIGRPLAERCSSSGRHGGSPHQPLCQLTRRCTNRKVGGPARPHSGERRFSRVL